ncbi:hypothetical protein [Sphingosinicella sp.]|uniref:hypothetical protein n=1 Tax=Sphingosinicella sp. TaxID=1917971 RepID=UPI004037EAED
MASAYFFEETTYWSPGDEDAHFAWLDRIAAINGVRGEGRRLFLDIDAQKLTAADLRELQAVYRRYGGDLAQLDGLDALTDSE